ncbi:MAG: hypothetical protein J4215_06220 [Candidatus Diapherotrites archaeon]|uniref:Protein export membrane protein SecD/SecF C-terminal domain-containing protein n=1 Tax=Candidatus Iainarchaeum sp. TaxID=3101447 RepID=A0A8T4L5M5_9ARCH|nr:hypothetical protein [Candidatus Diapherotrites archaeon]
MNSVWTNWRVLILIASLLIATFFIALNGLQYGIDFKGGTSFQVKLAKATSGPEQMNQIVSIIGQRMDWTGLSDTTVTSIGNDLLLIDIGENDPAVVEKLESLLLKQGKFEATLNGEVLFTGSDFVQITRDPAQGFGVNRQNDSSAQWTLPFMLKPEAAKRFTEKTFHKCEIIGVDASQGRQYDCEKTFFFIDRPENAVIVESTDDYLRDRDLLYAGNVTLDIPAQTEIGDLMQNAGLDVIQFTGSSLAQDQNAINDLNRVPAGSVAVVSAEIDEASKATLAGLGFQVREVAAANNAPFIWNATGAKQVISLSPDVTNLEPYVEDPKDATIYSQLVIRGFGQNEEEAFANLNSLTVLLESGSLPIPVESISRETISPLLGQEFLNDTVWMGVLALLIIGLIIFIRYRHMILVVPIMATAVFEAFLVLGIAAALGWKLDLAYVAGIIAAIGTGVNDQIVITDELLKKSDDEEHASDSERVKRAFFIVIAAASTSMVTMLPIILVGVVGLGKLVGFAITTVVGVLVGVLLTRPAYGEIAKYLLSRKKN